MKKQLIISALLLSLVAAACSKTPTNTNNTSVSVNQNSNQSNANTGNETGKIYTLAEVKTHNKQTDCWLAVNGSVYNVTSFIPNHPGGPQRIIPLCGTDATSNFTEQHDGQPKPETQLASLKIGTLK